MIDFSLTEEQELLLEQVTEFMKRGNYDEEFKQADKEHRLPERARKDYMEAGFHKIDMPKEYGGEEADIVTTALMKLKFYELGFPALTLPGGSLEMDNILAYGTKEQQDAIINAALAGHKPYTLGFSEPQAGSDNGSMTTRATHKDGKVIINGHKTFNTGATCSPYMMCIAREYENLENPYKDMSWYLVPLDAPGVKISELDKIGCHCMPTCEVYLDNVELPESALVGKKGRGFYQLMKNFETERLFTCVSNVGMALCAYNDSVAYIGTREQFGHPVGDFQILQEKVADMKIKCDNMVNMLLKCAWKKDRGEALGAEASLLKRYTGQAAFQVIDDAMQLMGGIGYTNDSRIARLWRDQRGARIYAGTEEVMVHSSARTLIKEAVKKAANK